MEKAEIVKNDAIRSFEPKRGRAPRTQRYVRPAFRFSSIMDLRKQSTCSTYENGELVGELHGANRDWNE